MGSTAFIKLCIRLSAGFDTPDCIGRIRLKVKKIRILTYCCWTSFGSILQSYALSKTLLNLGYNNTIWLENWNREIYKPAPKNAKDVLKYIYSFFNNKKINNAHKKRQDFILNNLDVEYFPDDEAFVKKASENTDDIYLAGSDQIWNPDRCNPLFFLDFVKSSKKISYAASMGNTTIAPGKVEKYRNLPQPICRWWCRNSNCPAVRLSTVITRWNWFISVTVPGGVRSTVLSTRC